MVFSPGQGSLGTQSNASLEEMNKTRGNFCRGAEEEGAIRGNMAAGNPVTIVSNGMAGGADLIL